MKLKADVEVPVTTAVLRRLVRLSALAAVAVFVLGATLGSPTPAAASSGTVWRRLPGHAPDPCTEPLTTTVVQTDGETERRTRAAGTQDPPINCFYVYPTVCEQAGANANLDDRTARRRRSRSTRRRASRRYCKVYAPMYPQLTLAAHQRRAGQPTRHGIEAYLGVGEGVQGISWPSSTRAAAWC